MRRGSLKNISFIQFSQNLLEFGLFEYMIVIFNLCITLNEVYDSVTVPLRKFRTCGNQVYNPLQTIYRTYYIYPQY